MPFVNLVLKTDKMTANELKNMTFRKCGM